MESQGVTLITRLQFMYLGKPGEPGDSEVQEEEEMPRVPRVTGHANRGFLNF